MQFDKVIIRTCDSILLNNFHSISIITNSNRIQVINCYYYIRSNFITKTVNVRNKQFWDIAFKDLILNYKFKVVMSIGYRAGELSNYDSNTV